MLVTHFIENIFRSRSVLEIVSVMKIKNKLVHGRSSVIALYLLLLVLVGLV